MELVLNTFGAKLSSENNAFIVANAGGKQRIPVDGVSSIMIAKSAVITTDALMLHSQLKRALPYFVCAKFENGLRRIENFSHLEAFVLDIDHFEDSDVSLEELKKHLAQDERVVMAFISPSGNGLKVLLFLDEPCKDANIYTSFYKRFAVEFAKEYHLENYVDYKTCDVTRDCFLASDVNATLNLNFIAIHMDDYVNTEAVDLFVHDDKLADNECQVHTRCLKTSTSCELLSFHYNFHKLFATQNKV